jgi:hypothetical protein
MIGLNRPQMRALDRYIDELVATRELSAARIQQLIDRRFGQLLTYRSRMIAATEGQAAGQAGVGEYWRQASAEGILDSGVYVKEWVIRPVGACPICLGLDRHTAELQAAFYSALAGRWVFNPPAHPWCYCGQRLRRREEIPAEFLPTVLATAA